MRFLGHSAGFVAVFVLLAPPAFASAPAGVTLSGGATLVSDYRFRGISLSDEDPAVQGTLNVTHDSGLYAGVWGSSLADTDLYGHVELDHYAGWRGELASGTALDVGLLYYYYPDSANAVGDSDYAEPYTSLTHAFGPVTGKVGAAYAFAQGATGDDDNLYLYTDWTASIPSTPVSLRAHAGHSDGSLSPTGDYWEWALGADLVAGPATFGITYVDTDLGDAANFDAGIVLSVGFAF